MTEPISDYQLPIEPSAIPPQPTPVITSTPTPKKSPILPILIGVVFVALVGVAGYFAYQYFTIKSQYVSSPSPTNQQNKSETYLTYTDSTFTFQYPSYLTKLIETKTWGVSVGCGCELFYWFDAEYIPTTLSPIEWWEKEGKTRFDGNDNDDRLRPKLAKTIITSDIINHSEVDMVIAQTPKNPTPQKPYQRGGEQMMRIYLIPGNNGLVMITVNVFGDETELSQILSTLRFNNQPEADKSTSKPNEALSTENWKTFSSTDQHYTFQYPQQMSIEESDYQNDHFIKILKAKDFDLITIETGADVSEYCDNRLQKVPNPIITTARIDNKDYPVNSCTFGDGGPEGSFSQDTYEVMVKPNLKITIQKYLEQNYDQNGKVTAITKQTTQEDIDTALKILSSVKISEK